MTTLQSTTSPSTRGRYVREFGRFLEWCDRAQRTSADRETIPAYVAVQRRAGASAARCRGVATGLLAVFDEIDEKVDEFDQFVDAVRQMARERFATATWVLSDIPLRTLQEGLDG